MFQQKFPARLESICNRCNNPFIVTIFKKTEAGKEINDGITDRLQRDMACITFNEMQATLA